MTQSDVRSDTGSPPSAPAQHTGSMRAVLASAFVVTAVFVVSNSPTPLYVHWQSVIGFGSGTLTVIFGAYILGLLLTLLVAGQLSDHFGRRRVLLPGLVVALVSTALFVVADNVAMLILARLLTGVSVGVIVSAGMAAVVDAGGDTLRATAARLASVAMVLGAGLGPLFAGILAEFVEHPIPWVFGTEAALIVLAAFSVATANQTHRPADRGPFRLRLPSVPTEHRRYVLFGIAVFGPGITATSFVLSLGPSLLTRELGITSPVVAGGTACAMFLVATAVQFAVARVRVRTVFIAGATSTALAMVMLIAAVRSDIAALLIVSALLAGAGQGLGQLGGLTLIGLHVPQTSRAQGNALMNIGGYIPAGTLPIIAGYLIDATTIPTAVTIFGSVLFAAAVLGGTAVARSISANDIPAAA